MTASRNRLWTSPQVGLEAWESTWAGHVQPRHSHDDYQISLTRSGLGSFVSVGVRSPCEVGQIVVIGPGEVHEVIPSVASEWRFDTLYLSEAAVRSIDVETRIPRWGRMLPRSPGASSAFLRLHRAVVEGAPELEQEEHILGLLDGLGGEPFAELGAAAISSPGEAVLT
ncbi:AraC family ligand binding domain-containing protein, partial [Singulisphaera rosea]